MPRPTLQRPRAPALFGNTKPAGNVRGEGAGNMNRRTFPPKTATAPNRDSAGKEFRDHHPGRHKSKISPERNFRLWNSASGRFPADKSKNQTCDD